MLVVEIQAVKGVKGIVHPRVRKFKIKIYSIESILLIQAIKTTIRIFYICVGGRDIGC